MKCFRKILIVDDDPDYRYLTRLVLQELHLDNELIELTNGQQALDYILQHCINEKAASEDCPDWILLDLNMPLMNGIELLVCLEELGLNNPLSLTVTVVTTSNYHRDREQAAQYGVSSYLVKPLTEESLRTFLEEK